MSFVSAQSTHGTVQTAGLDITGSVGGLATGESAVATLVVRPESAGNLIFESRITAVELDPDPANNSVESVVRVGIVPSSQFTIQVALIGDQIVLSWPVAAEGFVLQSTLDPGSPAGWAAVGSTPATNNGTKSVSVGAADSARFFRLFRQP